MAARCSQVVQEWALLFHQRCCQGLIAPLDPDEGSAVKPLPHPALGPEMRFLAVALKDIGTVVPGDESFELIRIVAATPAEPLLKDPALLASAPRGGGKPVRAVTLATVPTHPGTCRWRPAGKCPMASTVTRTMARSTRGSQRSTTLGRHQTGTCPSRRRCGAGPPKKRSGR